jgi:uridine phosphorylase
VIVEPQVPLLEFDGERSAVIEPATGRGVPKAPAAAVACFFPEVVAEWTKDATSILDLPAREHLWEVEHQGQRLALFYPGMGGPLAASRLECAIAAGCRAIVACGAAGALLPELEMGHHVISVTAAVRDEGTSYHYLEPARTIDVAPEIVEVLEKVAHSRNEPYIAGMTWTTDGYFRETPARVARRRAEGCLTVEMEAAAMLAVARFRGVRLGHYLYAADDLAGEVWDHREWWDSPRRNDLTDLAADAAFALLGLGELPGT